MPFIHTGSLVGNVQDKMEQNCLAPVHVENYCENEAAWGNGIPY